MEHRKNRVAVVGLRFSCLDRLFFFFREISCCCCCSYKKRRRPQLPKKFFSGKRANAPCSRWRTGNMELYRSCTTVVFAGKQKLFFKKKSLFLIGPLLLAEMCENGYLHFLPPLKRPFVSFPRSREFVFKLLLLILPAQKLVVGLQRIPARHAGGAILFSLFRCKKNQVLLYFATVTR